MDQTVHIAEHTDQLLAVFKLSISDTYQKMLETPAQANLMVITHHNPTPSQLGTASVH